MAWNKLAQDRHLQIGTAISAGHLYADIAGRFGISVSAVCYIQRKLGLRRPSRSRRNAPLTLARLKEVLSYDSSTGEFTRLDNIHRPDLAGNPAGSVGSDGYCSISVDGRRYKAHRLAWFYVHGRWPSALMDHRNLRRADNRIDNLREATSAQNISNSGPRNNNVCGFKGVVLAKHVGRWKARITVNRRAIHLGYFDTPEAAHAAYVAAAQVHFGEFAWAA